MWGILVSCCVRKLWVLAEIDVHVDGLRKVEKFVELEISCGRDCFGFLELIVEIWGVRVRVCFIRYVIDLLTGSGSV